MAAAATETAGVVAVAPDGYAGNPRNGGCGNPGGSGPGSGNGGGNNGNGNCNGGLDGHGGHPGHRVDDFSGSNGARHGNTGNPSNGDSGPARDGSGTAGGGHGSGNVGIHGNGGRDRVAPDLAAAMATTEMTAATEVNVATAWTGSEKRVRKNFARARPSQTIRRSHLWTTLQAAAADLLLARLAAFLGAAFMPTLRPRPSDLAKPDRCAA